MIRVKFWGVRGSIPAPGPATAGIGGNTSCVEIRCSGSRLVFDAGTGLRLLGREMSAEMPLEAHLFFSHVHWDHIQGFPFFAPAFVPGNTVHMYGARSYMGTVETALAGQMEFPNFPVVLSELPSSLVFHDVTPGETLEVIEGVRVRTVAGKHPGGVLAYRVEHGGSSVVYATDTEYRDEDDVDQAFLELCRGADVLIFDSMYTPDEYFGRLDGRSRVGWGHSTYEVGASIAHRAGVGEYILFHHDPDQDDDEVRDKEAKAQALFPASRVAQEGLVIELP
ncbi:MAG: MBL fold metallo-hydrolase [Myxococcales bacterium]|nr:MBL fold metallo-hydrolase [Myxococcales bacterium]